jgi:hypothetical protein
LRLQKKTNEHGKSQTLKKTKKNGKFLEGFARERQMPENDPFGRHSELFFDSEFSFRDSETNFDDSDSQRILFNVKNCVLESDLLSCRVRRETK